jgi:NTP pyrophosphatase (non-canonical NTP hydrolase)
MWIKKSVVAALIGEVAEMAEKINKTVNTQSEATVELGELVLMLKSVVLVQEERIAQLEIENGWSLEETTERAKDILSIMDNTKLH